jgi:hypothetical protein
VRFQAIASLSCTTLRRRDWFDAERRTTNGASVGARHELVLLVTSSFETKARIERDADGYFRAILGDREPKLHDAPPS